MKRQSAANILKYIKLLDVTDNFLDDIYVVCPCYKTENKSTIDFQASISGSPYYMRMHHAKVYIHNQLLHSTSAPCLINPLTIPRCLYLDIKVLNPNKQ